jgi:hypothetical protein
MNSPREPTDHISLGNPLEFVIRQLTTVLSAKVGSLLKRFFEPETAPILWTCGG